jgi:hypothetical protein
MNEPWKTEPIIWELFCLERGKGIKEEYNQQLFNETRFMKEEYEWFRKGYLSHRGGGSVS